MSKRTHYRLPVFFVLFCTLEMSSGRAAWCRDPDGMAGRFGATRPDGLPASRAWCLIARKPLFLRHRAPRSLLESGFEAGRRGASPPANPYPFVVEHHAGWANRSTGPDGVVLHRPQTLIPSSSSTTSDGRIRARGRTAWCLTARKPLSLRRRAPRRMGESEHGAGWRGASPPANPCFFVAGHHAPDFLSTGQFREPAAGSRNSHLPQKTKNVGKALLPQHLADISLSPINQ